MINAAHNFQTKLTVKVFYFQAYHMFCDVLWNAEMVGPQGEKLPSR